MAEERAQRRLAAILAADVVGYSRLMEADEEGTLRQLRAHLNDLFGPKIAEHSGRIVKTTGDGLLAEFQSVVEAVRCAIEVQRGVVDRNADIPEVRRIKFRIGVNLGDVIVEDGDIYGDGVNVAARLQALAEADGILLAGTAYDHIKKNVDIDIAFLGEQRVKNIEAPVRVYRVLRGPKNAGRTVPVAKRWNGRRQGLAAVAPILLFAVGIGAWIVINSGATVKTPRLPDKPSIAVLPFANMSGDSSQEYFADGVTDDVITGLSKVSGLFVIARNSTFTYKRSSADIRKIASDLAVQYVLEGSIQRSGDRIRINAWLVDSSTGANRWAEQFDGPLFDVFALQDKVTRGVADALAVQLIGSEQQALAAPETSVPSAYDAFLRGWDHYRRSTPQDFANAIPYLEQAITLDPAYERPRAVIAMIYIVSYNYGWTAVLGVPAQEALRRARQYVGETKKHPTAMAHQVAGFILMDEGKPDLALAEFKEGIALDPGLSSSYQLAAFPLISAGRPAEALRYIDIAMRLDPHPPANFMLALGLAQFSLEKFQSAAASLEAATRLNPDDQNAFFALAATYGYLARKQDAESTISRCNDILVRLGGVPVTVSVTTERGGPIFYPQLADWQRMQKGLRLAGVPEYLDRSDFASRNRLTAENVRSLFYGHRLHGRNLYSGAERKAVLTSDGSITLSGQWGQFDADGAPQVGTVQFSDAEICLRFRVTSYCGVFLRNPGGTKVMENEFLWASPSGGYAFSIVE
jgi:TolB-like protein/class 3 adenylate cyclase